MVKTVRLPKAEPDLLLLHIELQWSEPAIWRRVVVPATITLGKLHGVIQIAMGWHDEHLHEFVIAGEHYGIPDTDGWGPPVASETRKTLIKALNGKKTFRYLYDFGDSWDHQIKVVKTVPALPGLQVPYCVEGANACPPENTGGWPGYVEFLKVMADPNHPEHEDILEWHGEPFDPTFFDKERVNQWLMAAKI